MTKGELKELCDVYRNDILNADDSTIDRLLRLLTQEVEMQVRHECVSMAYDLANNINNMNKED